MKIFKPINIVLLSLCLFSQSLYANDVLPLQLKKNSTYVRVIKFNTPKGIAVSFEDCLYGSEDQSCRPIGSKRSYLLTELQSRFETENLEMIAAIAGDVLILGASAVGGVFALGGGVAGLVGASGTAVSGTTSLIAGYSTIIGAGYILAAVDAVNPFQQAKEAETLSPEVLQDKKVPVKDIHEFISNLRNVLEKIKN